MNDKLSLKDQDLFAKCFLAKAWNPQLDTGAEELFRFLAGSGQGDALAFGLIHTNSEDVKARFVRRLPYGELQKNAYALGRSFLQTPQALVECFATVDEITFINFLTTLAQGVCQHDDVGMIDFVFFVAQSRHKGSNTQMAQRMMRQALCFGAPKVATALLDVDGVGTGEIKHFCCQFAQSGSPSSSDIDLCFSLLQKENPLFWQDRTFTQLMFACCLKKGDLVLWNKMTQSGVLDFVPDTFFEIERWGNSFNDICDICAQEKVDIHAQLVILSDVFSQWEKKGVLWSPAFWGRVRAPQAIEHLAQHHPRVLGEIYHALGDSYVCQYRKEAPSLYAYYQKDLVERALLKSHSALGPLRDLGPKKM